MNYSQIASDIIRDVGGKENIISAMHCATRLRLRLKDYNLVNEEALTDVDQVKGVFLANDQYQIILGSGTVNMVTDELLKETGLGTAEPAKEAEGEGKKGNWLSNAIKTLSDIFVPIIPAIVAGGLLMGLNNVLTAVGLFVPGKALIDLWPEVAGLATFINMCAAAPFTFLPVLIGFSAAKKFGGNAFLGAALGMIMVHPDLLSAYAVASATELPTWNWFGLEVGAIGYQGTVLPVLASAWILANIEKRLHKVTPSWLDNLTTPLISLLVTAVITFVLVGPIMRSAGDMLAAGLSWLYSTLGFIGGAIFGLFYAPITITGMHHSFSAIETQLIAAAKTTGGSFIFPVASMNNVAQGAAVLTVLFLTKNEKMKSICSASGISALLGITEPAMFGVTLKLKYPFYAAIIGSACGSAWIAGTRTLALAMGAAGLPGIISIAPQSWVNFVIGLVISMTVTVILTVVLMKKFAPEELKGTSKKAAAPKAVELKAGELAAPMTGEVKPVSQSSDPMFASKAMGDGIVINPTDGLVSAPANATVTMIFPTRHALGLTTDNGEEILIHVGLDTVSLEGKPFEVLVEQGQKVTAGQPLLKADLEAIRQAGLSVETPMVITNGKAMEIIAQGQASAGTPVMKGTADGQH